MDDIIPSSHQNLAVPYMGVSCLSNVEIPTFDLPDVKDLGNLTFSPPILWRILHIHIRQVMESGVLCIKNNKIPVNRNCVDIYKTRLPIENSSRSLQKFNYYPLP
jgi:hypothetical protein